MSMMEPFSAATGPASDGVPAADPGTGVAPAPGYGVAGEEPDPNEPQDTADGTAQDATRPSVFRPPTAAAHASSGELHDAVDNATSAAE